MAGNAINNLVNNRDTIRKLMAMDSNGKMDKLFETAKQQGKVSLSEDGVSYNPGAGKTNGNNNVVITEEIMQKSKMPKTILESFKQNPGTPLEMPTSVLDGLDLTPLQEIREEKLNETAQVSQPTNASFIDYSLIRTIINEAVQENVKKYVSAMTKKLMTESVSGGVSDNVKAVKLGEKFSFITENGDVYEATLKYKTNLNEQTKNKKVIS